MKIRFRSRLSLLLLLLLLLFTITTSRIPETIVLNKDKKIIKKFVGYLDDKSFKELNFILK